MNRLGHPPLVGMQVHGDAARFGDIGAVAGEQVVGAQHMPHDRAHGWLRQQFAPDRAFVDQHPDALVDAAGRGGEGLAPDAPLIVGELAPLLFGAAVFKGVAAFQFRLRLFQQTLLGDRQLVGRHSVFDQTVAEFVDVGLQRGDVGRWLRQFVVRPVEHFSLRPFLHVNRSAHFTEFSRAMPSCSRKRTLDRGQMQRAAVRTLLRPQLARANLFNDLTGSEV